MVENYGEKGSSTEPIEKRDCTLILFLLFVSLSPLCLSISSSSLNLLFLSLSPLPLCHSTLQRSPIRLRPLFLLASSCCCAALVCALVPLAHKEVRVKMREARGAWLQMWGDQRKKARAKKSKMMTSDGAPVLSASPLRSSAAVPVYPMETESPITRLFSRDPGRRGIKV